MLLSCILFLDSRCSFSFLYQIPLTLLLIFNFFLNCFILKKFRILFHTPTCMFLGLSDLDWITRIFRSFSTLRERERERERDWWWGWVLEALLCEGFKRRKFWRRRRRRRWDFLVSWILALGLHSILFLSLWYRCQLCLICCSLVPFGYNLNWVYFISGKDYVQSQTLA